MINVGRVCVKIAGRDSGKIGVVVKVIDENNVIIDGQVRRKKCNVKHLEPLENVVKIKDDAAHADVKKVLKEIGVDVKEKKGKVRKEKVKKARKVKEKAIKKEKPKEKKAKK
jgi:large subunit ribosomal protein L14e